MWRKRAGEFVWCFVCMLVPSTALCSFSLHVFAPQQVVRNAVFHSKLGICFFLLLRDCSNIVVSSCTYSTDRASQLLCCCAAVAIFCVWVRTKFDDSHLYVSGRALRAWNCVSMGPTACLFHYSGRFP